MSVNFLLRIKMRNKNIILLDLIQIFKKMRIISILRCLVFLACICTSPKMIHIFSARITYRQIKQCCNFVIDIFKFDDISIYTVIIKICKRGNNKSTNTHTKLPSCNIKKQKYGDAIIKSFTAAIIQNKLLHTVRTVLKSN